MIHRANQSAVLALLLFYLTSPALGQGDSAPYPSTLLWGDTHLHSNYSADANTIGNTALTPIHAYAFAKGERVQVTSELHAQLTRPLDFLVVSDHAEYLGALAVHRDRNLLERVSELATGFFVAIMQLRDVQESPEDETAIIRRDTWERSLEMAEEANDPGNFSAIAGFEWTSMPQGDNLHRVVLFRDGIERTRQVRPYSVLESHDPRDLWAYLAHYEAKTTGQALAIPHNGNVSNGRMFALTQYDGSPMTSAYAEARARWEPLVEVTQIKGDSETHPLLSPNDEFSDYGTWDAGNLGANTLKQDNMLAFEYARSALKLGLQLEDSLGVNPFQFGMIGSTDAHTSLATADDDNFWGKAANQHPNTDNRFEGPFMIVRAPVEGGTQRNWSDQTIGPDDAVIESWEQVASGYAAVWATENTREAIFDAMKRREVYASTGPRISVRFFGGWDIDESRLAQGDPIPYLYASGVPMGGSLESSQRSDSVPSFYVFAQKDPEGANLDRIQIIKGWIDAEGALHEQVYDVAWSGERRLKAGRLPPLTSTVDLSDASYSQSVGAAVLTTLWRDPDYDANEKAFYYARVLEISTPRWTAYDEARSGRRHKAEAQREHQERVYTSPIWLNGSR